MARQQIVVSSYQHLLGAIKLALSQGLLAAQKILEFERLKTYWQIGKQISVAIDASKGELRLGDTLYQKISSDLNRDLGLDLSPDAIGRTIQFYKNYPRFPEKTTLTFSHYIALQRVSSASLRLKLEQSAIKENLSVAQLKDEITKAKVKSSDVAQRPQKRLACERGEPFVYYLKLEKSQSGQEIFRVDCGFKISTAIPKGAFLPDQSRIVRSVKDNDHYTIHLYKEGRDKIYTYAAVVTRVVDGDTMDARIDVGFGIGLHERLRFKGIDAPEINTAQGRLAKKFVEESLRPCPVIVIRSSKSEMYGRWLADVFYLPGCEDPHMIAAKGEYLNQTLLDQGLARLYP